MSGDFVPFEESSDAHIDEALREARVGPGDIFYDLGAGLGKVVAAAKDRGAIARGIEIQPGLVAKAKALGRDVVCGDCLEAELDDGTVFYLYSPFTGATLGKVMERLENVAAKRPIRICAVSVDVNRAWLRRSFESFWVVVYESI